MGKCESDDCKVTVNKTNDPCGSCPLHCGSQDCAGLVHAALRQARALNLGASEAGSSVGSVHLPRAEDRRDDRLVDDDLRAGKLASRPASYLQGPLGVAESPELRLRGELAAWAVEWSDGSTRCAEAWRVIMSFSFGVHSIAFFDSISPIGLTHSSIPSLKTSFEVHPDWRTSSSSIRAGLRSRWARVTSAWREIAIGYSVRRKNDAREHVSVAKGLSFARPAYLHVWLKTFEGRELPDDGSEVLPEYHLSSPSFPLWWFAMFSLTASDTRVSVMKELFREYEMLLIREHKDELMSFAAWSAEGAAATSAAAMAQASRALAAALAGRSGGKYERDKRNKWVSPGAVPPALSPDPSPDPLTSTGDSSALPVPRPISLSTAAAAAGGGSGGRNGRGRDGGGRGRHAGGRDRGRFAGRGRNGYG